MLNYDPEEYTESYEEATIAYFVTVSTLEAVNLQGGY